MESANLPNRERDLSVINLRLDKKTRQQAKPGTAPQYRNLIYQDTISQAWLVLELQTSQLHSFELANKKRFLRSAFCCCFPMAQSTLLTASLECSDLDSTTYSQIEAVLDPVEVVKLLWPGKIVR